VRVKLRESNQNFAVCVARAPRTRRAENQLSLVAHKGGKTLTFPAAHTVRRLVRQRTQTNAQIASRLSRICIIRTCFRSAAINSCINGDAGVG
jgi:hypothetical protein